MSFFKKLFGKNETIEEQCNELLEENNVQITVEGDAGDEENITNEIEVIVNDVTNQDSIELLNDVKSEAEKIVTPVQEKKSIKEIVNDVTEFIEKSEQATQECNEPKIEEVSDLIENIGIINNEVVVEHNIVHSTIVFEETKEIDETKETKSNLDENVDDANETDRTETDRNETLESVDTIEAVETPETLDEEIESTLDANISEIFEATETIESEVELEETEHIESYDNDNEVELPVTEVEPAKKSFFAKLKEGVKKTRDSIFANLNAVFNMFTVVDDELFEELEEALILADMGVDTSLFIINELKKQVKRKGITEVHQVKDVLIEIISDILIKDDTELVIKPQTVILVIGVNGAGKTTTIGKLAHNLISDGLTVTVAAADTFRAAAIDQLQVWAERSNAHFIRKEEGSDPASVVFDACQSAKARGTDVLIIDTAGRLQNKKNLMEELKKINRIIEREFESAHKEVFLVLDSTTGQNAMQQAKLFNETADITGLVLTKLDGTAKGGVIVSIKNELNVPVRYVGLGEKINDLEKFDSKQFAKAMFE